MPLSKSKSEHGTALQRHLNKKNKKARRVPSRPRSSPSRKVFYVLVVIFLLMIVGVVMWLKSEGVSFVMFLVLLPVMIATYVKSR
jgi:Flp pilus assembly protein TadB